MMIPHSKPYIDKEDINKVVEVIRTKNIAQGKVVEELEKKFANYLGVKYAACTSSGTTALHLALLALGIKKGDEVIIPSYTCSALLNCVYYVNATPVLVDISYDDFNIDIMQLSNKLSKKVTCIIVPHMFGAAAAINEIKKINVDTIEDITHSVGAKINNRKVGTYGKLTICSFYATKFLSTGEGGIVLSNTKELIDKIKDMREYDKKDEFIIRYNYKLTDFQAALGITQLNKLEFFINKRRMLANIYNENLVGLNCELPQYKNSIYYRYVIKVDAMKIETIINKLKEFGIEAKKPIYKPLHHYLKLKRGFENTEKAYRTALSLPIYPNLTKREIKYICKILKRILF